MPANDQFWRPLSTMHKVSAVSALLLLLATYIMMAKDHRDEWRQYQATADELKAAQLNEQLSAIQSDEYEHRRTELQQQQEAAEAALAARSGEIDELRQTVARIQGEVDLRTRQTKFTGAKRDVARAEYDIAVRDAKPDAEQAVLKAKFDALQQAVDEMTLELDVKEQELAEAKQQLATQTAEHDTAADDLKILQQDAERITEALANIAPGDDNPLRRFKRWLMLQPIIDGFNSPHGIRQEWLPDLPITLGMATTARFDRCRTCHVNINDFAAGNVPAFPHGEFAEGQYPHPYSAHPNPDVYLTSTSPHPMPEYGCTICHDGDGSGTSFQNAEHTPNHPAQAEKWHGEYGWHSNHFWEYPMQPERFIESSCLKCHHSVVELGVNETYGATAPKVYEGYEIIKSYGCFGCHEINGFDGGEPIGPDLRLEPGYAAAAQQLLSDPVFESLSQPQGSVDLSTIGARAEDIMQRATRAADDDVRRELIAEVSSLSTSVLHQMRPLASRLAQDPNLPQVLDSLRDLVIADTSLAAVSRSLMQRLPAEEQNVNDDVGPFLSPVSQGLSESLKAQDRPGDERKVGPSLRHIAAKTTPEFVAYWTEMPSRFRPSTRMPQFFHLSNQEDGQAERFQPVQLAAIAAYLDEKSQPLELMQPQEGYEPSVERGKAAFARRGCLACHSHDDPTFEGSSATFGPDLSKVNEKIKPGEEGFNWLYTWIRDPMRHHARTKMPDLFLEPEGEGEYYFDPAADIAAFLLQGEREEFPSLESPQPYLGVAVVSAPRGVQVVESIPGTPARRSQRIAGGQLVDEPIAASDIIVRVGVTDIVSPAQFEQTVQSLSVGETVDLVVVRSGIESTYRLTVSTPLDDLVRLFARQSLTQSDYDAMLEERAFPRPVESIKGDEIELARREDDPEQISDGEWEHRKMVYVGRRTISFYGCYGCHDIPEFETARPIGTALQDWGRKDTSKLALEHVEELLHHHGGPDTSVPEAAEAAVNREFHDGNASEDALSTAYFYDNLIHHGRPGFIWQKLRQPRSYDYRKTETKRYDERLRMPKFPFTDDQIEAVATFVLGLVAEPPPSEYIFQPDQRKADVLEGERLLDKYNCGGCHVIDLPEIAFAANPDDLIGSELGAADYQHALNLLMQLKPPHDGLRRTPLGEPVTTPEGENIVEFKGFVFAEPDPDEDPEFQEYSFDLWETLKVGEKTLYPASKLLVPAAKMVEQKPARGGDFAQWLVPHLMDTQTDGNRFLAWQASPPPLYQEGIKVQTPWLFEFLKNPDRLRYTTVLRMPKFNMTDEEAQSLANYFAAAGAAPYPYQPIPQQQPPYLDAQRAEFAAAHGDTASGYLGTTWNLLNAPTCIKCHSVGGNEYTSTDPQRDIRGPDLDRVARRLQPDWTLLWLYKPAWITPYTSMPTVFPKNQTQLTELFGGGGQKQTVATRDALMNYYRLMEAHGQIAYQPEGTAPPEEAAQPEDAAEARQTGSGGE